MRPDCKSDRAGDLFAESHRLEAGFREKLSRSVGFAIRLHRL